MLNAIRGIGCINKRPTFAGNLDGLSEILKALEGISCSNVQQPNFVSKINKAKKLGGKETTSFPS